MLTRRRDGQLLSYSASDPHLIIEEVQEALAAVISCLQAHDVAPLTRLVRLPVVLAVPGIALLHHLW